MQPAKKIKRDKTPEQAYAALIRLCARSEKSSGDALRLMQRWGVKPSARQGVLQKLLADRFIDDNRYAEAFVRDKIRLSGWGARKIRTSLRLKGIAAAIIDEALARLDPANQSERLRTQLEKKLRLTRYKDTYDLKTKLIRYGLSLGYDYDAVLDAAGELIQTNDDHATTSDLRAAAVQRSRFGPAPRPGRLHLSPAERCRSLLRQLLRNASQPLTFGH